MFLRVGKIVYFICANCGVHISPVEGNSIHPQVPSSLYWKERPFIAVDMVTGKTLHKGPMQIIESYCSPKCSISMHEKQN